MTPDNDGIFGLGLLPIGESSLIPPTKRALADQSEDDLEEALRELTRQAKWLQETQRETLRASNRLGQPTQFAPDAVEDLNERRNELREGIQMLRAEAGEREEEVQEAIKAVREELLERGRKGIVERVRDELVE